MPRKQSRNAGVERQASWEIEDSAPEPQDPATPLTFTAHTARDVEVESPRSWRVRQVGTSGNRDGGDSNSDNDSEYGEDCRMSLGWLCFIMGFILIVPWALGMVLPLCSVNKNDKWAGYWNGFATLAATAAFVSVYYSYPE